MIFLKLEVVNSEVIEFQSLKSMEKILVVTILEINVKSQDVNQVTLKNS